MLLPDIWWVEYELWDRVQLGHYILNLELTTLTGRRGQGVRVRGQKEKKDKGKSFPLLHLSRSSKMPP